jgi:hypothetical protein
MNNLALGKSDFEAINSLENDHAYLVSNGNKAAPSEETVRQRMDELAETSIETKELGKLEILKNHTWILDKDSEKMVSANELVQEMAIDFLKRSKAKISPNKYGYVTIDLDTTTLDNSRTKKEKVEYTYQEFEGYSPIAAYLGQEGWNIGLELRPGSMHGQNGFGHFLTKVIERASYLTPARLLCRMDCAFDAAENYAILLERRIGFTVKRNNGRITNRGDLFDYADKNKLFKVTKNVRCYDKDLKPVGEDVIEEEALFSLPVEVKVGEQTFSMTQVFLLRKST